MKEQNGTNKYEEDRQPDQKETKKNPVRPEERHYNHGEFIGPNTYKSKEMHENEKSHRNT